MEGRVKSTTREHLRRTAEKAVETCPGIEAIVLFGSRARGSPHPGSDWDVAVLSHGSGDTERAACEILSELDGVNPIVLRPEAIDEHRDRATRVEAAIARQGRLLAGSWRRPPCRMEDLEVTPEEFTRSQDDAINDLESAIRLLSSAALRDTVYVSKVVEDSQQAAEAVAKCIIAGFGLAPRQTHDLAALASTLESAWRGRSGEDVRRSFANEIRSLNGNTRAAHAARYEAGPVEEPGRTVERIIRTQRLQTRWIRWYVEQHPDVEDSARALGERIASTAVLLEEQRGFERIPSSLQAATRSWGDEGKSMSLNRSTGQGR
jgi:predicted nucleotidyltransferase/HEPN domain-containing protein